MKLIGLIQEEIENYVSETPDGVSVDNVNTNYDDRGAHPFVYNIETKKIEIGNESSYHDDDDSEQALYGPNYIYPGRLFLNDKVISFWTYPNEAEFRDIIDQIGNYFGENLWNHGWRIEVFDEVKRGTHDYSSNLRGKVSLVPIEQYAGSKDVSQNLRDLHLMKQSGKADYMKKLGMSKGGGSDKYGTQKPLAYRQALMHSESDELEGIINDEIKLQEDPDTTSHPDSLTNLYHDIEGAYAFGYTEYEEEFMVSGVGGTHGDLVSSSGQDQMREGVRYGGRIWIHNNVMSFWEYPPPHMIREVAQDLENELGVSIINNPEFVIETLVDTVGEPVWDDDDDKYKSDRMHWAKGDDTKFLTVPEYEKLDSNQIQQRSAEELAKQHVGSPMDKPHRKPVKGSGSSKYGTQKPLAFRQALVRSESANIFEQVEKILKEWTEDQMYDIYDMRDEVMRDTLYDWLSKPYGTRQPWTLVPFGRLKKIWEDAYKTGVVRDEKGLDMIQARMIKNLLKLDVNTEIMGHSTHYPEEEIESLGYTMEQFHEKNDSSEDVYFEDLSGQWRLSDYGLKPLWEIAQNLVGEEDDSRRIMYIDQMLNVIHMRSDMAGNFVEGGSSALSQLSGEHAETVQ